MERTRSKNLIPDTIRLKSTGNVCSPPLGVAHTPEVAGSSPAAATRESPGFIKNLGDFLILLTIYDKKL